MQERLWKSRYFMYALWSQSCSGHCGCHYDCVFIFTRLWCTPTRWIEAEQRLWTCAHIRRGSYPILERLVGVYGADSVKARIPQRVSKMFGFDVIKHYEMHCESYKCPLNKLAYVWPTQSAQSENGCVFVKTKLYSILTTALQVSAT